MDTETIMQFPIGGMSSADAIPTDEQPAVEEIDGQISNVASPETLLREEILRRAEAEGLTALYPAFDADEALSHPELGAFLRGEATPDLRRLYEITHLEEIVESRVQSRLGNAVAEALASAVPAAVSAAVAESEERLLGHIRARGQRPDENGISAASGIRMHLAVDRLTRRERAMLAERAERGETVKL